MEPALCVAAEQVIEYSAYGQLLTRDSNRGPVSAPQGLYPCAAPGAYAALAVATDEQWRSLLDVLGNPAWARGLETAGERRIAHDAIDDELRAWFRERERDAAVADLLRAGVPAAALINAHDLSPNPQLEHREFFQVMEHPRVGKLRYPGLPMRFSRLGPHLHRRPPPTLGQHNEEILAGELGLSREEIESLREDAIIGERPSFM